MSAAQNGVFEHEMTVIQLAPGILTASRNAWSAGRSAFLTMQYSHGVQLRLRVGKRPAIGYVLQQTSPVISNGVPLSLDDITVVRDTVLDISSLGPFGFMYEELGEHVLDPNDTAVLAGPLIANFSGAEIRGGLPVGWADRTYGSDLGAVIRTAKRLPNSISARQRFDLACSVEKLIGPKMDEPISLRHLSDITGRSERSVIYAFKKSFGLGPISYFKVRRLNAVRERLLRADSGKAIVYIAADHGFWHLGHFGADYKEFFGETPSQTRRRARVAHEGISTESIAGFGEAHGAVHDTLRQSGAHEALAAACS